MRLAAHSATRILTVGLAFGIAAGCASVSLDENGIGGPTPAGTGGSTTTRFDAGKPTIAPDGGLNLLCGHNFNCTGIPDDPTACKGFHRPLHQDGGHAAGGAPGSGGAASGGSSGTGGTGGGGRSPADAGRDAEPRDGGADASDGADAANGTSPEGGSVQDAPSDSTGDALDHSSPSESDARSGEAGPKDSGSMDGRTVEPPPEVDAGPAFSCQVGAPPTKTGGDPFYQCRPAGDQKSGSACTSSSDCRAGLACVSAGLGKATTGICLPYCCDPATVCQKAWLAGGGDPNDPDIAQSRLYCGERPLIDGHSPNTTQSVPVCVTAVPCNLKDPYPCPDDSCTCPPGTACTVKVLPGDGGSANEIKGTTACDAPGKGRTGDRCSAGGSSACAAGYFCSEAAGVCLKVCSTDGYGSPCTPGKCQATAGFPSGWGVCVGPTPAAK